MTYKVSIDPGVNTGMAIIESGIYVLIETTTITKAIHTIDLLLLDGHKIDLYVEDPNLRKWYGNNASVKQQGAGSVKRDFSIWKQYAKETGMNFHPVHPKDVGSSFDNEDIFKQATGWDKKASQHARDAAKIIFKFKK